MDPKPKDAEKPKKAKSDTKKSKAAKQPASEEPPKPETPAAPPANETSEENKEPAKTENKTENAEQGKVEPEKNEQVNSGEVKNDTENTTAQEKNEIEKNAPAGEADGERVEPGDENTDSTQPTKAEEEPEDEGLQKLIEDINKDKIQELEEAFELFDINGDGLITHSDLKRTLTTLGHTVTDEEVTRMLSDGSMPLDVQNFIKMIVLRITYIDPADIMTNAFSKWDYDQTGFIPLERMQEDLMTKGDCFTEKEMEQALEAAPIVTIKGKPMIDYIGFCENLCAVKSSNIQGPLPADAIQK